MTHRSPHKQQVQVDSDRCANHYAVSSKTLATAWTLNRVGLLCSVGLRTLKDASATTCRREYPLASVVVSIKAREFLYQTETERRRTHRELVCLCATFWRPAGAAQRSTLPHLFLSLSLRGGGHAHSGSARRAARLMLSAV